MNEVSIEIASNFQYTAICFMAFFTPDYTIEFIAKRSGFASDKYFYPVFKKITGMTPLHFLDQLTDETD